MIAAALLALTGVTIAACGNDGATDLPYAVYAGEPNGDAALLQGTLALEDGCLYVTTEGGQAYLAFAEGTASWDTAASRLTIGDIAAVPGDVVHFGGSALSTPVEDYDWVVPPGENCITTSLWFAGDTLGRGLLGVR